MKYGSIVCAILFVLGVFLFLAQVWFSPMTPETFWKLIFTIGVLLITALVITLVFKDYLSEKKMKEKGYID